MKALHFGAGNIGRGFIGKVLADAGIHVTFADVAEDLINTLIKQQSYTVKVVGSEVKYEKVTGVSAVNSMSPDLIDHIASVDMITTAVGPNVLNIIAKTIAQGLQKRIENGTTSPLNIIACENMVRGTTHLKNEVMKHLDEKYHAQVANTVGFVDSAVDRIVPPADASSEDPLEVTVETFSEWIVDETQFVGDIPDIKGMERTDNLMAFVERKLFTLNTGHCITSYLGSLAGHRTIRESIEDEAIKADVKSAMQESGEVLVRRYGFDADAHAAYIEKILGRFANPYLVDEVDRVGRQPIRKLGAGDRLTKPLLGTMEYGIANDHLIKGMAAALFYVNADDPQAVELQDMLSKSGVKETVAHYSGLPIDSSEVARVDEAYQAIKAA